MNAGSIHRDTAAGRVYAILLEREGLWFDAWELSRLAHTTCLSTRLSEVKFQLPADMKIERRQEGKQNHYRLVKLRIGQGDLFEAVV